MKDILVTFDKPISGWWDGGPRTQGQFHAEVVKGGYEKHESFERHLKWGCYEFNHWVRRPITKFPERNFIRFLKRTMRVPPGNSVKFEIMEDK
jgi:hypothetical protein